MFGTVESAEPLKLFVVGERSGNPDDWRSHLRGLVIAHNAEEAISVLGSELLDCASEVKYDQPKTLMREEERFWVI